MQIGSIVQVRFDVWGPAPMAGQIVANLATSGGVTTADVTVGLGNGYSTLQGCVLNSTLSENNTFKVISSF